MDGFRWHSEARVFGSEGVALLRPFDVLGVCADRPVAAALEAAFGAGPFRIGAVEAPAPLAGFETLTSGSTGVPRRIARDVLSWQRSFAVNAGLFGIGPGVGVAVLGRLVQSLSLYGAVEGLSLGADVHVLDGMRPDRQRAALAVRRVQVLWASPPQVQLLVEAGGADLPDLRFVLVGGAKLDAGLRAGLAALCPAAVVREFYGAAEASFITLADDATPAHAVGRAYPGVEIGIGGPFGTEAEGRVWVRSPYLFAGYAGADAGVAEWRDGWLGLGEVGRIEAGQLVLRGRIDRMVTVAGQNAYPEAMELFLLGLRGVARAAVVPRADALRGQVLEAVVMGSGAADVLGALRAQFGPLIAPKRVHWREDWPVLPSGKVDLAAIAQGTA
ncbi:AMP-binding protein [Pseudorhodobacter ferrugineus]|uniref:AMP-binding protein n=1 Tax=Pseudorhodobacter ferrugineus TaxID=77008 RepID=UPI0003B2E394|nr:AMP-binding protein [Pseudorhodobacter ferrugineus]